MEDRQMNRTDPEKDYEIYRQLLDLWTKENPIKTHKLQTLLLTNAILLAAVGINDGFVSKNWPIYLGGTLLCLVWLISIGRTVLFQKLWQAKMSHLAAKYPDDARFRVHHHHEDTGNIPMLLQVIGGIPSKYYLIGTPLVFGLGWLCVFLYFIGYTGTLISRYPAVLAGFGLQPLW
jgi:hypothetical protein